VRDNRQSATWLVGCRLLKSTSLSLLSFPLHFASFRHSTPPRIFSPLCRLFFHTSAPAAPILCGCIWFAVCVSRHVWVAGVAGLAGWVVHRVQLIDAFRITPHSRCHWLGIGIRDSLSFAEAPAPDPTLCPEKRRSTRLGEILITGPTN